MFEKFRMYLLRVYLLGAIRKHGPNATQTFVLTEDSGDEYHVLVGWSPKESEHDD